MPKVWYRLLYYLYDNRFGLFQLFYFYIYQLVEANAQNSTSNTSTGTAGKTTISTSGNKTVLIYMFSTLTARIIRSTSCTNVSVKWFRALQKDENIHVCFISASGEYQRLKIKERNRGYLSALIFLR